MHKNYAKKINLTLKFEVLIFYAKIIFFMLDAPSNEHHMKNVKANQKNLFSVSISVLIAVFSSAFFVFNLTVSSFFLKFLKNSKIDVSNFSESLIISLPFIGALFGNIFTHNLNINYKTNIISSSFLFFLSTALLRYFVNIKYMLIFRFITGLAIGITCAAVPSYIGRIAPISLRGLYLSFHQLFCTIGCLFGYLFDYYYTGFFESGIAVMLLVYFMHIIALCFIITDHGLTLQSKSIGELLLCKEGRKSTFMAAIFHGVQQLSGINTFLICLGKIIGNLSKNVESIKYIFSFIMIGITIFSMIIIDMIGRKPLMIVSIVGIIIGLFLIIFQILITESLYLYISAFAIGLGPVTWLITNEIFPRQYLSSANLFSISFNWIFGFLTVLFSNYLFNIYSFKIFIFNLSVVILYLFYIIIFYKETKNKEPAFQ